MTNPMDRVVRPICHGDKDTVLGIDAPKKSSLTT